MTASSSEPTEPEEDSCSDIYNYSHLTESGSDRLARFFRGSPLITFGLMGMTAIVGYQLYNVRRRPKGVKLSSYLMHLRLYAQGFVVSTIVGTAMWKAYNRNNKR